MHAAHLEPSRRIGGSPFDVAPPRRIWTINVLVVDDDEADTALIVDALKRHPGVSATRSSDNPEQALKELAVGRISPDLVFLDINMPRMDGFTFLRRMRDIPDMAATPVVLLTTSGHSRNAEEARRSSAVSYVIKPDTYPQLQGRLDAAIRRTISNGWRKPAC